LNRVDEDLPSEITDFLWCFFEVMSTILIICYATPIFIAVVAVLVMIFFAIVVYFIGASRQLKRLESLSESPILSTFHETLSGTTSIRTFGCQERFVNRLETLISSNVACHYNNRSSTYWLGLRMELLGSFIVFFSALLLVLRRGYVSGGTAGLALMYGFEILEALAWMVHMACNLEIKFVCVERLLEYLRLPQEDDWQRGPVDPEWPRTGRVHFVDYATRYRDELDLVLSDINLMVPGKEKLGICGRTGAGKSSLTLALFRIIEAAEGRIVIDDLDISRMGLHSLRSRLTIIPQDPMLFTGNVRFNLDPTEQFTDEAVWAALQLAHLKDTVEAFSDGLGHEVSEGGKNFSVGQRQLLCLARALLRKTKILVLDEATASVDLETDSLIQATIKEAFSDCTVITIAHRLNTILGYDRIAVLQDGMLKEIDAPHVLINAPQSTFRAMAQEAGIVESARLKNI
jgi:ABC-type multidrug transport system fused ATPase/permease subunit